MRVDRRRSLARGAVLLSLLATVARAENLRIASVGPEGEIAKLEEAREIRVVFSEPMVVLGRIPEKVEAPFFRIEPAVPGAFRWSGTRVLIFSPSTKLPFSTRYEVTIEGAVSAAGSRLEKPYQFSFTTPTVRLLRTSWYRRNGKSSSPVVLALHFNQPIDPAAVLAGTKTACRPHDFQPPPAPAGVDQWKALDPAGFAVFQARVEKATANASASAVVTLAVAKKWNRKWFPAKEDMAVFETTAAPPPETWISIEMPPGLRGKQGREGTKAAQEVTVRLEPAFFVEGFRCDTACDPDSWNPLRLSARVPAEALGAALKLADITEGKAGRPVPRTRKPAAAREEEEPVEPESLYPRTQGADESPEAWSGAVTPEEAGFALAPARTYRARVDARLRSEDGQVLGYTWFGTLENWHQRAFTSFGSGHGVWEAQGGPVLPFYARNLKDIRQWLAPLKVEDLVPTLKAEESAGFGSPPPGEGRVRRLAPVADKIQSYGLDVRSVLSPSGTGLMWAAVQDGETIPKASHERERKPTSTLVQVTNLGISVKDSPKNTLLFVTRLDDGRPVPGARVSLRTSDNRVFWTGTTDADGIAIAPSTELRDPERWYEFAFLATAEKDGDLAYAASNWNEGLSPWLFNANFDLSESKPLLRGSVFSDRGVYKLGEEVHFKAVVRSDTADGIRLLPKGTEVSFAATDSHGKEFGARTLRLSDWGTADGTVTIPADGSLGRYGMTVKTAGQKREISGDFLVAAYRRPDFRVDANLAGETSIAGVRLSAVVTGKYLFGAAMGGRPVQWTYSRQRLHEVPRKIAEKFPEERWAFLGEGFDERPRREEETLQTKEAALDPEGRLTLTLDTKLDASVPWSYTLEGEVTDVSRQKIAGRASFRVDPAPWYIAVRQPPFFADVSAGFDSELASIDLEGKPVAGVRIAATLRRVEWHSVRRGEGKGFYTWETEKREIDAGRWEVETKGTLVPLHVAIPRGGFYVLSAAAKDDAGHSTTTRVWFYALGEGFTAWQRYDHNRIDLVPEKKTYRPGETARLLVKSPWEKATALLTTEREGICTHRRFELTSTQQTVEVPISEADIPNLYVSILLVKGRTASYSDTDASDPGKPSYRLGYAELKVEDSSKRLAVAVRADREEYRPASKASVEVSVADAGGAPGSSEVTLWAVDYGVLSLTAYKAPELVESVYVAKALQVLTEDSRQNIVNRRVIVAKGADEGGGGGAEEGPGQVRRDFRVLAFWLGSLVTDARGKASTEVTLPESLTTYRIMAVAGDKASRFGWGQIEIRINKPLVLKSAFPRFLSSGDTAFFGSILTNQTAAGGDAIVTMQSLDPGVLDVPGEPRRIVSLGAKSSAEVRFAVRAKAVGKARLRMTARLSGESDAFEDVLPVEILSTPETVAAYGQANPAARETVEVPAGVVAEFGGLSVDLSSTALVGLSEGARYLVDYPYGCAEQRASSAEALMLAADLGDAFRLPGIDAGKAKEIARATLKELEDFRCPGGGFAFWKGACRMVSPYLTSYVLSVFQRAERLGYDVRRDLLEEGYEFLEHELESGAPEDEGWWPAYTAWQAFAVKVLSDAGRNVDSHVNRLYARLDRMPVFALAYLLDSLSARGETGARPEELKRRISNAVLPEGGSAHVEELADPYLLWFWNSNVRSTAIVLESLVRRSPDSTLVPGMARWLLAARRKGRWGNTQENALALAALVEYYRRFEKETPDFKSSVTLAEKTIAKEAFRGRSTESRSRDVPMKELVSGRVAGEKLALDFLKDGPGTLYYAARLRYVTDGSAAGAMDQGFAIERDYQTEREGKTAPPSDTYAAGDLVRVTLTFKLPKERRYVAVTDPLPAGLEPVESWFATTAAGLARVEREEEEQRGDWMAWWRRGGFDHVERHDDRVLLFATRLSEGVHTFSYLARATTAGTFRAAPARIEEMYEPEVFGRTASAALEVKP